MFKPQAEAAVYVFNLPVDMRSGFDRLASMVQEKAARHPTGGGLFVFLSRNRKRVKILYWDRDGYALWYKRLEAGTFKVEFQDGYEELTGVDLELLLSGIEIERIRIRKNAEKGLYL